MAPQTLDLDALRSFVRNSLDVDDIELPDVLLDRYIADGSNRIDNFSRVWNFRTVQFDFDTVADTQDYDLETILSGDIVNDIIDIRGPRYSLEPVDHRQIRAIYRTTSAPVREPLQFSIWGTHVYLWPIPNSVYTLNVMGYRQIRDWMAVNDPPDFPAEFHELIAYWALNRAYAQQDDPEMADFYRAEFGVELANRSKRYTEGNDAQPLIFNSGPTKDSWRAAQGLGPLIYDWE